MQFVAPCLLGLEGLAANDLKYKGISDVRAENGRVLFGGDERTMVRANLCTSLCARVFVLMAEFEARSFEELFEGVKAADWNRLIGEHDAFPVKGNSLDSVLNSIPACQKIIKKAVVEKLKERYHNSWFDEDGGVHQIQFRIFKNRVSIYLDTTGEALNKRGYRALSTGAPLKETLAAAMTELARVRSNHIVVDPFCGSGTIVIEAARKAMNIMPGIDRGFAFEDWSQIDPAIFAQERQRAREEEKRDAPFMAYGYDIDDEALEIARQNAALAGVADKIVFEKRDIREYTDDFERCSVITNPPYGERLLDVDEARDLYRMMGKRFLQKPYHSYTIISPDERFEQVFGRTADKRRKLYNGALKCQVYMYYK